MNSLAFSANHSLVWFKNCCYDNKVSIEGRDQRGFGAVIGQQSKVQEVDGESKVDASLLRLQIQINGRKIQTSDERHLLNHPSD